MHIIDYYGKKSALRAAEMPVPPVNENDVLVEIHAAAVNLLDSKIKSGEFKLLLSYKPPFTLGHDVAGVLVKVGSQVKNLKLATKCMHVLQTIGLALLQNSFQSIKTT